MGIGEKVDNRCPFLPWEEHKFVNKSMLSRGYKSSRSLKVGKEFAVYLIRIP